MGRRSVPEAIALLIAVCWILLTIVRFSVHRRRTGSAGLAFTRDRRPTQMFGGALIACGLVAVFASAALEAASFTHALFAGAWWTIAGTVLAVAGMSVATMSEFALGASWRVGVDRSETTDLVTAGPFGIVRNPIFSAMIGTALGVFLLMPDTVSVAGLVSLVSGVEIQVRLVEEPHLVRVQGDAFRRYAATVGRFVPGVGRLRFRSG